MVANAGRGKNRTLRGEHKGGEKRSTEHVEQNADEQPQKKARQIIELKSSSGKKRRLRKAYNNSDVVGEPRGKKTVHNALLRWVRERDSSENDQIDEIRINVTEEVGMNTTELMTRNSPKILVEAIEAMNVVQKASISEMGFGGILELRITGLPHQLCYWILDNFDPKSCEIKLGNGKGLQIDPEDVYLTLGMPRGEGMIKSKTKHESSPMLQTWMDLFKKEKNQISPKDVVAKMLEDENGGDWFKRHFLVLVTSCLIETSQNGYVVPQIMNCLVDVSKVGNLDWCGFVIKKLVSTKLDWETNKSKRFRGPILFLLAMYVDRVVLFGRTVPRDFPTIKGWTKEKLRDRHLDEVKAKMFGAGRVEGRYEQPEKMLTKQKDPTTSVKEKGNDDIHNADDALHFADNLIRKTKLMADTMLTILDMVKGAPRHLLEDVNFKRVIATTHQLLGCADEVADPYDASFDNHHPEPSYTQAEDEFWADPTRLALIDEIEKDLIRQIAVKKHQVEMHKVEMPSFSLGLTQDEVDVVDNIIQGLDSSAEKDISGNCQVNKQLFPTCIEVGNNNKANEADGGRTSEITTRCGMSLLAKVRSDAEVGSDNIDTHTTTHIIKSIGDTDKNEDEPQMHVMVRRPGKSIKLTECYKSPYRRRNVMATEKLTRAENALFYWVVCNNTANMEEILFSNGRSNLRRREMLTMAPMLYVSVAVLDVWSQILNHNEKYRSKQSPYRFFCSTDPCCYTIVDPPKGWGEKRLKAKFFDKLNEELGCIEGMQIQIVDMFVFPIYQNEHFYLIAFNLRSCTAEIIDNSMTVDSDTVDAKYGGVPELLKSMFVAFLSSHQIIGKSIGLGMAVITRLVMPWRDDENKCDCAIYAMRHMETYMGKKAWNPGLKTKAAKQMAYMRAKYCAAILTAENNVYNDHNVSEASVYYRLACNDGPIDVMQALMDDQQELTFP